MTVNKLTYPSKENAVQEKINEIIDNLGGGGANTDLSNLTSQGQNIANWSSNVTNCITEIPQDIKLELSGTTLTLKAGSKVYIPNGKTGDTLNFTEVILSSDLTYSTWGSASTDLMIFYNNGALAGYATGIYSGATQPTTAGLWYDTANNYMKYSSNGTSWAISNHALPLGLVGRSSGTPTAIHQVFNGIGYIGSTVFALPNVKGLIPNGRNVDGSLKNIEFETSSVITRTWTTQSAEGIFMLNVTPTSGLPYLTIRPTVKYDEISNKLINVGDPYEADVGLAKLVSGSITSFTPKTAFHALDYNDSSTISGWAMPSSRFIALTLLASGNTYTAPANGWFYFDRGSKSGNKWINISNGLCAMASTSISGVYNAKILYPVRKNDIVTVSYTADTDNPNFKFIYADGEQ